MKATNRLLDTVWTAEYQIVREGQVEILNYSAQDAEGYEREYELPRCHLVETDERIVTHLLIKPYKRGEWVTEDNATEKYEVVNPMYIFSYKQKIHTPKILKATKRLINAIWTIEYEVVSEGKAKVLNFSNVDEEGYNREQELPQFELEVTDEGVVSRFFTKPYKIGEWTNEGNATEIFEIVDSQLLFPIISKPLKSK